VRRSPNHGSSIRKDAEAKEASCRLSSAEDAADDEAGRRDACGPFFNSLLGSPAVRFTLDQTLPAGIADVLDAFTDPGFLELLADLPKVGSPELLDQRRDGDLVHQRVRYRFSGELSPAVRRVLDVNRLTWVDERTYDLAAGTATFHVIPDHYEGKLRCEGSERFLEVDDRHTTRHVEADLSVRWPIVGGTVERAIVSGLRDHLEDEAVLVARWLEGLEGPIGP
jgi:hypothetical protein